MKNLWILACALIAASCSGVCDETVNVIPKPSSVEVNEGTFTFSGKSAVVCEDETLLRTAEIFAEDVQAVLGRQLEVKNEGAASGNVVLSLDDSLEAEEYELNVSRLRVALRLVSSMASRPLSSLSMMERYRLWRLKISHVSDIEVCCSMFPDTSLQ